LDKLFKEGKNLNENSTKNIFFLIDNKRCKLFGKEEMWKTWQNSNS